MKTTNVYGRQKSHVTGRIGAVGNEFADGHAAVIFIWLIAGELFKSKGDASRELINTYAGYAMGTAVGDVFL